MKKVIFYIVASSFLFSTMEVVLKIGGAEFDVLQITSLRFLVPGLMLLPFAVKSLKKRRVELGWRDWLYSLAMGILCICCSMVLFHLAVLNLNASAAAILFCSNPMFTILFAHLLTDEKLNKAKTIAIIVSLAGICVILDPLHMEAGNSLVGFVYIMLSSITFGLYSALSKKQVMQIGGIAQTSFSFILGALILSAFTAATGHPLFTGIQRENWLLAAYIFVFVSGLGYLFYFLAMEGSDAATASVVFLMKPVFAPVVAVLALGETITGKVLIGVIFILAGSYINLRYNFIVARSNKTAQLQKT